MQVDMSIFGKVEKTMLALLALVLCVLAAFNWQVALLCMIAVLGVLTFSMRIAKKRRDHLSAYMHTMTFNVNQTTHYALQNLPIAISIIDDKFNICWANSVFTDWFHVDVEKTQRINVVSATMRLNKIWGKSGYFTTQVEDRTYRIIHKFIPLTEGEDAQDRAQGFMALYYDDITELERIRQEAIDSLPVLAYIEIDNLEDITKGLSDIDHTNMWAQVNNVIVEEIDKHQGFVRSYSENAYIACISKQALQEMIKQNFPILDRVRAIHTTKRMPITISMGVALDEGSFKEQIERAGAGLDLALGRGGDQAAVYKGADVQFYGGTYGEC